MAEASTTRGFANALSVADLAYRLHIVADLPSDMARRALLAAVRPLEGQA